VGHYVEEISALETNKIFQVVKKLISVVFTPKKMLFLIVLGREYHVKILPSM
jgi:hypothetical protein